MANMLPARFHVANLMAISVLARGKILHFPKNNILISGNGIFLQQKCCLTEKQNRTENWKQIHIYSMHTQIKSLFYGKQSSWAWKICPLLSTHKYTHVISLPLEMLEQSLFYLNWSASSREMCRSELSSQMDFSLPLTLHGSFVAQEKKSKSI